jgi:ATP-dependent Clp protease adaptor protein ClpS
MNMTNTVIKTEQQVAQKDTLLLEKTVVPPKPPQQYQVIMINDDYTPMEFVVSILESIFYKDKTEATQIMLQIHHQGRWICGTFAYDIANTKIQKVTTLAQEAGHPLKCISKPKL